MILWVDAATVGLVVLSALWGLFRGMVREFFSLAAWVGGFYVAWNWGGGWLAPQLPAQIPVDWRVPLASLLLFFACLIVGALCAFIVRKLLYGIGFGATDRFLGAFFGFLRGLVLIAIVVTLVQSSDLSRSPWWESSWLAQEPVNRWSQSLTAPAVSYLESQKFAK
ncbi:MULTISPECIES: CvpA family protein [Acidithiobacillus]|jgi:membrane protein required for colicin V production|uniref:CvpA family protein n=2 Tax=Acidithiobacillus ferrooxidans TaxID=920 RepID=B7J4S5_ACIF2|nr:MULTISPECIES: CvpA family protein [Acidithiobacillus]MCL5956264.1 CvpA family protein [Gammaproteobacteria bacterium]ACH83945.1 Colicin V production protein [Acidithiobacillus ferrooxidans ATCC 53993]ACK77872.1 CvpA family protein [Acidithiobacillus ferrooxidans ATCC 23270]MBN6745408.1 CvpA family protein [Acidithiobacillus sp. MC2.2]MBN6748317.1 CvpA family protein [Acidithiobacillus sp. PG05]